MIFQSPQETANLLAQKILEEGVGLPAGRQGSPDLLVYINPDSQNYCRLIGKTVKLPIQSLEDILVAGTKITAHKIIIADTGDTRASEYVEFTDRLRELAPETSITIAVPVIPEHEKPQLEDISDTLLYLHSDPLFFSVSQFYQSQG